MPPVPPRDPDAFPTFRWTREEILRAKAWAQWRKQEERRKAAEKAALEFNPFDW